ncbi:MAG: cupin-like domain-containing protein, partial [Flavobacteriaceae bacterium]|nr:cupin-like domain-containing protein [Flavobacteriaceae bacterium]
MSGLNLKQIDRVEALSKKEFINNYVKNQIPVVITSVTKDWPAYKKWSLDYMSEVAGDKRVPLYDDRPIDPKLKFNEPHTEMLMRDYVQLLKSAPTNYRIFLYNLLKEVPSLKEDYRYPDLGLKLLKSLPMLFFGGAGSRVFMHYDIDCANILHFHFAGDKHCILFPPSQTKYLYKVPNSLITLENIRFDEPDLETYPAIQHAQGYECHLKHGDMLYMPEAYWHYMKYTTASFSISLRALPRNPKYLLKAVHNVLIMRHSETLLRRTLGQDYLDKKNAYAKKHTE